MTEIMTLNEFKEAIEEWGSNWGIKTQIEVNELWTSVYASLDDEDPENQSVIAMIFNKRACVLNFAYSATLKFILGDGELKTLFKIVTKFANTWPADRKYKEKKYLLRFKSIGSESYCYLNYNKDTDRFGLDDSFNTAIRFQTYFSLKEIEEIKNRLDIDLKDFELIEVEEDA